MDKLLFLLLIFSAVIFETIADVFFKFSHIQSKPIWLWFGVGLYTVGTIIWAFSLKYDYLSKAISIFTILNLVAVIFVGFLFFHEDLSLINKLGIGLGVLSVILMQI
ncbi:MAG: hypothetical protein HQ402_03200 [Parcubacteria group bacterium]|nr:hypothetical protein [Parcubacteria group bacterium]